MTTIIYTALRELTGLTAANELATMEIGFTEYSKSRATTRDVQIAKGGAREILYHRAEQSYTFTFQPVNSFERRQLDEFLASTESGEAFDIYIYGTESTPITVSRSDDGHQSSQFMQVGTEDKDYWQSSITVVEV